MRARIKKGVRPYGGRTFDVLKRGTSNSGREFVELDVTSPRTKFGLLGKTSSPRTYRLDEVELIDASTDTPAPPADPPEARAAHIAEHIAALVFRHLAAEPVEMEGTRALAAAARAAEAARQSILRDLEGK